MMHPSDGYEVFKLNNLKEILSCFSPVGNKYGKLIYRGQANSPNSIWNLVPSAFRNYPSEFEKAGIPTCFNRHQNQINPNKSRVHWNKIQDLKRLLEEFGSRLDNNGILVPVCQPYKLRYYSFPPTPEEINPVLWPMLALARHHGLPTNLLDWSKNPLKSLYFPAVAISELISNREWEKVPEFFSVWSVNENFLLSVDLISKGDIRFCEVPASSNLNMAAQEGVFTLHNSDLPMEEIVGQLTEKDNHLSLCRTDIPANFSPQILSYLNSFGINGASMFPGISGIIKSMKEQSYYK